MYGTSVAVWSLVCLQFVYQVSGFFSLNLSASKMKNHSFLLHQKKLLVIFQTGQFFNGSTSSHNCKSLLVFLFSSHPPPFPDEFFCFHVKKKGFLAFVLHAKLSSYLFVRLLEQQIFQKGKLLIFLWYRKKYFGLLLYFHILKKSILFFKIINY